MEVIKRAVDRTHTELNPEHGYQERHYQTVLQHYIRKFLPDSVTSLEVNIPYRTTDGFVFHSGRMDIVVETETEYIILELKANIDMARSFKRAVGQTKRYLTHARSDKIISGMLVVFGGLSPLVRYLQKYDKLITVSKQLPVTTMFGECVGEKS